MVKEASFKTAAFVHYLIRLHGYPADTLQVLPPGVWEEAGAWEI